MLYETPGSAILAAALATTVLGTAAPCWAADVTADRLINADKEPQNWAEAQKIAAAERAFRVALLQATETCKNKEPACNGGNYNPTPSPRFAEFPPRYNVVAMNRNDGPEDGNGALRCLIFNPVVADDEILGFHDNLQNGRPHCAVL